MTDKDLEWLVLRWQYANEHESHDDWCKIRDMCHGAYMAVYRYDADEAGIYDCLSTLAEHRRDAALENDFRRAV